MLKVYQDVLQMVAKAYAVAGVIEKRDPDLARQLRRCSSSVALNVGEGGYSHKGHRVARYKTAMGSASEVRCTLQVAAAVGWIGHDAALDDQLDKIIATLWRLTH